MSQNIQGQIRTLQVSLESVKKTVEIYEERIEVVLENLKFLSGNPYSQHLLGIVFRQILDVFMEDNYKKNHCKDVTSKWEIQKAKLESIKDFEGEKFEELKKYENLKCNVAMSGVNFCMCSDKKSFSDAECYVNFRIKEFLSKYLKNEKECEVSANCIISVMIEILDDNICNPNARQKIFFLNYSNYLKTGNEDDIYPLYGSLSGFAHASETRRSYREVLEDHKRSVDLHEKSRPLVTQLNQIESIVNVFGKKS